MAKCLEMRGIEPRAFHMQSERSTTELHPRPDDLHCAAGRTLRILCRMNQLEKYLPTARLELAIFGLGDRRLIH